VTTTAGEGAAPVQAPAELVEAVLRLMPDAAVVVDSAGTIVAANPLADRAFRSAPGALRGSSVESLVPSRLRTRHFRHRGAYMARPGQRPMGAGLELWATRRDGSEFPVDISLTPLEVGGRQLTLASIRDITVQRAEWETEARLAAIVASSDDAMLSMDLGGTLVSWNPGAERLFGQRAEAVVGRSFWRLVPPELRTQTEERMARVRSGMRVPTHDTRRVRADGSQIDVAESMSLVTDVAGEPVGFAAVLRDITERQRTELELRHLLAESQRRERWLTAMSEVRLALFSGNETDRWLDLITRRVAELVDADGVLVALPADDDTERLSVAAVRGASHLAVGDTMSADMSLAGRAFRNGQSIVSEDLRADSPAPAAMLSGVRIGPVVLAPMVGSAGPTGVLVVTRSPGRAPFGPEDVRLTESFAQQAGLGMEVARAQLERAEFVLVADRERIARDLHDHVIQRLFAVGMSLQAAANSVTDPSVSARIEESVEELDATIRDVRSTIFSLELRATKHVETSARSRILDAASLAAPALGYQPRLQFDGPIDTRLPEDLVPDVLAVVRETLSNTARHAAATTVQVRVRVEGDQLVVEVVDDGRGAQDRSRSSGLANLMARAERRGGSMTVGPGRKDKGTRVEWRVPIT
jgi:PAS domain S-box-containing protein